MKPERERLKTRLQRNRPMTTISLRMPADVIEDLKEIAPMLGFTGYPLPVDHFGTRHGSMIRYCAAHPGSLGLVVSQDGDIRAITNLAGICTIFDNIKVHDVWVESYVKRSHVQRGRKQEGQLT